jgi:hypothetical protein
MIQSYRIDALSDILQIPIDRRHLFFKELELMLALHDFALGGVPLKTPFEGFVWTDDGNESCTITDINTGEKFMTLEVTGS